MHNVHVSYGLVEFVWLTMAIDVEADILCSKE